MFKIQFTIVLLSITGRYTSVGIASRCGMDGTRIESRWWQDIPHLSRKTLGPTQLSILWVPDLYPGGKTVGAFR